MDKDWIKAVTLLCIIAQNNADSMKRSVRYAEIMKKEYGYMVGIINGKVKKVPLGDVAGKLKMVSPDDQLIKEAKCIGISFGV